jgi:cell division transport system ATP-binding protein
MIEFNNVTKRYDSGQEILSRITFHLERGAMAFLTGNSGAGKTTLLKLIALIERPTRGEILVDHQRVNDMRASRVPALRRKIGLIFQNFQLLYDRSVFDNVALPLMIAGLHPLDIGRRTRAALDKVGLLSKEKAMPLTLSGGEQQRVGIARAVVNKPPILLADEPTGNLDPTLSFEIMSLFEQFNQVGVTVLVASHNLELINRFEKPIIHLQGGRRVDEGEDQGHEQEREPVDVEPAQPFANPYG